MAFRLVWTKRQRTNTESVWPNLPSYQQTACEQLKQLPGVEFFLSSITATTIAQNKTVNPGLAFWVALNQFEVHESLVYITMRNNEYGADLKIMTHKSGQNEYEQHVHNLSLLVKDYGPGFVQTKVASALGPGEQYLRDRIYMRAAPADAIYPKVLLTAQQVLGRMGLQLYLETY